MRELTLMIKPASGLCNLACEYCFYRDLTRCRERASYGVMSQETLEAVVRRACREAEQGVNFIFQGGEPTLAGLEFYRQFEAFVKQYAPRGLRVNRSIQTNATLIDEEWAAFLKRYGYLAGVSLDGPAELQNDLRPMAAGGGSFSPVMAGIRRLEKAGVPYNILTVVSEPVARKGAAVYRFLRKNGWDYLQFIPCLDPMEAPPTPVSLKPETYGRFLCTTFDLYFQELSRGGRVSVRWFDNVAALLAGYPPESCGVSGVCAAKIVLEADGSAYPCDFYVHQRYRLGSAVTDSFQGMLSCETARHFQEYSRPLPADCAACPAYPLCRNGCRRYRLPYLGDAPGKNVLCGAYRQFFDYAGERLVLLARAMRGGR